MSQFLSNKYLRYRGLPGLDNARVIDRDQPCSKCSYNLRGLMNNSRCPECGEPIAVPSPTHSTLLSDAPLEDIRRLALGLWLGVACIIGAPLSLFVVTGTGIWFGAWAWTNAGVALLVLALLWFVAIWAATPVLNTPDGAKHGFTAKSRTRLLARWSQCGWAAALLVTLLPTTGMIGGMAVLASVLTGLFGLIPLAFVLMRLADWSCDEPAGGLLNVTVWLLPLSTAVLLLMPVFSIVGLIGCAAALIWIASLIAFGLAVVSLASSASWSWKHAHDRMDRDEEMKAKIVRRPPPPPPSDEPIRLAEDGETGPIGPLGIADVISTLPPMDLIDRDSICRHCGYNLRGLRLTGRCPECGEKISGV